MATRTYKLPTVNAAGKMSFPDAVNGLATGVDFAMRGVQKSFGDPDDYKLPVATSSTLGGVRIGDGFKVFADGEIQPEKSEFVLKPATASALGGVAIGKNVDVDDAGKIIAGSGAFQSTNITESELAFGAVTGDKFRDGTILQEDLESALINKILSPQQVWQNAKRYTLGRGAAFTDYMIILEFKDNVFMLCYDNASNTLSGANFITDNKNLTSDLQIVYNNGGLPEAGKFTNRKIKYYIEKWGYIANDLKQVGMCVLEFDFFRNLYSRQYVEFERGASNTFWKGMPIFFSGDVIK